MCVYSTKTVPNAPTGLTSTTQPGPNIVLSWTAPTGGTTSYKLEFSLDGNVWTQIGGAITGTTYTHESLAANTNYYYRVSAVNSGGTSASTSIHAAKTGPNAPTGLTVTSQTASSIVLSWTAPADGATSYKLEYSLNGTNWTQIGGTITGTTYTHSSLTGNTDYYYRVSELCV